MFEEFYLADKLHVPVSIIRNMLLDDYYNHLAYYRIEAEEKEKQERKSNRKVGRKSQVF